MSRRGIVFVCALIALISLAVAGTASAEQPSLDIGGAELVLGNGSIDQMNVTGNAVCAMAGSALVRVSVVNLETNAVSNAGQKFVSCMSPAEHVGWLVTIVDVSLGLWRPGDRIRIQATATGAFAGTDVEETTLKEFH
jgi:hypothetical protein